VALAPLRYGAGIKGKVNEALSYGLPVVGTSIAFEGMDVRDGQEIILADEPGEFANGVTMVLRDEALWETLSRNGRASVSRQFSTSIARQGLRNLMGFEPV